MQCPRCGTMMEGGVCPECGFPVLRLILLSKAQRTRVETR